jgi:hypothetical protein
MTLTEAADICHRPFQRGPQAATLALADELIAQERREEAADIARAGTAPAFLEAAYELEIAAVNLRAFARGMLCSEAAREEIVRARHALAKMEGSL